MVNNSITAYFRQQLEKGWLIKKGKHCFEYKIQKCNPILSEYYYKASL